MNVSTPVAKEFLQLVDKSFPEDNPLHKIFNKNSVKVSYRTTPNMKQILTGHNVSRLKEADTDKEEPRSCSCPKTKVKACPLKGECLKECTVYQATVTEEVSGKKETYLGLTADPFKKRLANHTKSFKQEKYSTDSELSKHIWELKRKNIDYKLAWKIIDRAKSFSPVSKVCKLCTREKYYLIFKPNLCSLNVNKEFGSHCRHKKGLLHSSS